MLGRSRSTLLWLLIALSGALPCAAHANNCSFGHNIACIGPESMCWPAVIGSREAYGPCLEKFDHGYCLPCAGFNDPRACATDASDCQTFSATVKVPAILATSTVGPNLDGRPEVAVQGADHVLFHLWETDKSWVTMPAPFPGSPHVGSPAVVVQRGVGPLDVFALSEDGIVGHSQQLAPNANWGEWERLTAPALAAFSAVMQTYENFVLVGVSRSGDYLLFKDEALVQPLILGSGFNGNPAVTLNADARLELFGVKGSTLMHRWEVAPGGALSDWATLGSDVSGDPVAIQNADGRISVFVTTQDAALRAYKASQFYQSAIAFGGQLAATPDVNQNELRIQVSSSELPWPVPDRVWRGDTRFDADLMYV